MTGDRELMQMALEWIEAQTEPRMIGASKIIEALRDRLAQSEPDSVAWDYNDREVLIKVGDDEWRVAQPSEIISALLPPQEFVCSTGLCHYKNKPEQWVGLTEEEFSDLLYFDGLLNHVEVPLIADLIRAIEAKLKEKNT